ncbi:TetR/AcrR family transcriptional regulator [Peristeroidobacter agariperforans]|uniref:TetR/AcrR family transcriptional regulator n=1 Tax=Peristeroidobacter agariperforans TaxID=268404 RepID=UPI00101DCFD6|nr:TetR/AcrR family transcriptional regulator [Peristeroidobacter agariperforans]
MKRAAPAKTSKASPADRRRAHGERTRREILEAARRIAAADGLEALSIGRLATEVGMSKAGLFAHFGSKESLQIATIDAAWDVYRNEVLEPTMASPAGAPQLRSFMEHYFDYVQRHAKDGGCFFTAASSEFDDRAGPVRDRVFETTAERSAFLERVLHEAVAAGHLPKNTDVAQMTFEILALVTGTNLLFQLYKDPQIFQRARRTLRAMPPPKRSSKTAPTD